MQEKNPTKIQSSVNIIYCPVAVGSCDRAEVKGEHTGGLGRRGGSVSFDELG